MSEGEVDSLIAVVRQTLSTHGPLSEDDLFRVLEADVWTVCAAQAGLCLEEIIRKHEAAWLDESTPALAGYTPRECANDPTRRPDLIRLLDSFPAETGQPGEMSRSRLRQALGLS